MELPPDAPPADWRVAVPPAYGYLVARDGPPAPRGLVADIVLDGAGLYLAAAAAGLDLRVRLARAEIPGLPVVPTGVSLARGPIDGSLWLALAERATAAVPDEVLLAVVARPAQEGELLVASSGPYTLVEPLLDETGAGDWQPQQVSAGSVRATPVPDALVEVHSHGRLRAYFSSTDDRDERARRVYGVVGRLHTSAPEVALRVATGCRPHAVEGVRFADIFEGGPAPFRDLNFPDGVAGPAPARSASSSASGSPFLADLLLGMADDLAAIRAQLGGRPDRLSASLWTP